MIDTAADTQELASDLVQFAQDRCAAAIEQYLPTLRVPGYFAGQRITQDFAVDLAILLAELHRAGCKTVGGQPTVDRVRTILSQLDGTKIRTFYSFRVAETLLAFGGMNDNPVLDGLSPAQLQSLITATDSTALYDPATQTIGGHPNNYWAVLARCEHNRSRLGLLTDDTIYKIALEHTRQLLFKNPKGFFDDDHRGGGRYDSYSADVCLFVEPMWDLLGRDRILPILKKHVDLAETIALPGGQSVAWGRSIGALSLGLMAEIGSAGLHSGLSDDPRRSAWLVRNAVAQFANGWMSDNLISSHRYRATENYRGPYRLLQMTFDCLLKLTWIAEQLKSVRLPIEPLPFAEAMPARDTFVSFDNRTAGVWMFRNAAMEWQLPIVGGNNEWPNADYAAMPHAPGLFENLIEGAMHLITPRATVDDKHCVGRELPTTIEHRPGMLAMTGQPITSQGVDAPIAGRRDATWRAAVGDQLVIEERWTFDSVPTAVSYAVAEAATPLKVEWSTSQPNSTAVVTVHGMQGYTSAWSQLRKFHEIDFVPAKSIALTVTITPAVSVVHGPASHDYCRGMYDAMPAPGVIETGMDGGLPATAFDDLAEKIDRVRLLHIGWPEHLFSTAPSHRDAIRLHEKLAAVIRRAGEVVWTMHNRRSHYWPADEGRELYRLWAPLTDVALHHSAWSIGVMKADYPFRADCRHEVIPHGHFGRQMQTSLTRSQVEEKFKLPPAAMRFGLLGRYQPEKQIEMMAEAFHRAAREDQQLVVTAYDDKTVLPDDPRIIRLPRDKHMSRQQIAEHVLLCDALIAAQIGDTYLTSGMVGDAVAGGAAMIVSDWAFFREIAGDAALYHNNTVESLTAVLQSVTAGQIEACKRASVALQPAYDWANLSPKVYAILRSLRQ